MKLYKKLQENGRFFESFKNKNLRKTLFVTLVLCMVIIVMVWCIQTYGQSKTGAGCSYLDPPIIDILAFIAAIFLIIEGFWRILEHPNVSLSRQASRIVRIMLGCAITTIHVLQVMHK